MPNPEKIEPIIAMKKNSPDPILLSAGLLISLLGVLALPGLYFHKDLEIFWQWAQIWKAGWQNIYVACPACNYPILGMFSSAGLLSMLGSGYDGAVFNYRLLLSLVDGLNVLLIFWMLKMLKLDRPAYTAGIIGISIGSWAGGALWGQIDGISQFFILLSLAWIVRKNTSSQPGQKYYWGYLAVSAVLLACILLTKQLTLFSAFSLGLLLAADIWFHDRDLKAFGLHIALVGGVLLAALFAWDLFLRLKPPYFSHLVYIWQEGFFQGGIISGNGFNIWMLLGRDMWSSAYVPLIAGLPWANPYGIGQLLFVALVVTATLSLGLFLRAQTLRGETWLNRETLLNFILHLALINLCFNVFLSGTRERYLFHFYPYIILAWTGLAGFNRLFSEKILSVLVLGASLYGLFILQIISSIDFRLVIWPHMLLAVFHLGLFISLMFATLRYQGFPGSLGLVFRKTPKNLPTVR